MLESGERIGDRFIVEALIGKGGLSEVYRVRHAALGRLHAIKVLVLRGQNIADRLLLEGRIQAQLRHPNVVAVTDIIRHRGQYALVMEYVDHTSLAEFLDREAPLSVDAALEMFTPILSGVACAHDAGILHRDLKPGNVLLEKTPRGLVPKVTDFGIAKVLQGEMSVGRTGVGALLGTPGYVAPEQVDDASSVDKRTDVFALGAILYELLTGEKAFRDPDGEVRMRSTVLGTPVPLKDVLPDCPDHVARAVMQAIRADREDRHEDCNAFAEALLTERPDLVAVMEVNRNSTPLWSIEDTDHAGGAPLTIDSAEQGPSAPDTFPGSSNTFPGSGDNNTFPDADDNQTYGDGLMRDVTPAGALDEVIRTSTATRKRAALAIGGVMLMVMIGVAAAFGTAMAIQVLWTSFLEPADPPIVIELPSEEPAPAEPATPEEPTPQ